ncbi:MAG: LicD family protein [Selenomonadaceae bacterium]|nr:LicD family protein [Selenomonadaceae bacterium]
MSFIKDLYHDEIRDGYLVTASIKKYWNRYLEIVAEVDRICRKHKIKYWAAYGTLLGAARHKGFIPWDRDVDLCMMRPDFNRFCKILEDEFKLSGGIFEPAVRTFSIFKISHSQTTLITTENLEDEKKLKGFLLDIFPLDIAFEGTQKSFRAFNALNEIMGTIYNFPAIRKHVEKGGNIFNSWDILVGLNAITDINKQFEFADIFAEGVFDESDSVAWIEDELKKIGAPFKKDWFNETIYLPFETIELPAPANYDEVLTATYGDWRTPVRQEILYIGLTYSPDIPWREFMKQIDMEIILDNANKIFADYKRFHSL